MPNLENREDLEVATLCTLAMSAVCFVTDVHGMILENRPNAEVSARITEFLRDNILLCKTAYGSKPVLAMEGVKAVSKRLGYDMEAAAAAGEAQIHAVGDPKQWN